MSGADIFFYFSKAVTNIILPPGGLLLLAFVALLLLKRWPKTARAALWISVSTLSILSLPMTARALSALLDPPPFQPESARHAQALMILGGGVMRATPEYGDTLASHSLARVRYGAALAKSTQLPILVTGGSVYGRSTPEAELMAQVLAKEFSVTPRWIEAKSRHTAENARFSATMLKADGIRKVLVVTDDVHMRRALAHCEAAGLICYSAPVTTIGSDSGNWVQQLPSADALASSSFALHEILGYLALSWR